MPLKPPVELDPNLRGEDGADGAFLHVADGLPLDEVAAEVSLHLPEEAEVGQGLSI